MANQILSPQKVCTKCKCRKSIQEFGFSKATKDNLKLHCKQCRSHELRAWRQSNPEYPAQYREKNIDHERMMGRARDKAKYATWGTSAERQASKKRYYQANREKIIAVSLKWARDNAPAMAARAMRRLAQLKSATPTWADNKAIEKIYEECHRMCLATGERWHVDHIVPLTSNLVSGLHVHWNLQIMRASENISKSNRYWPDMP